MAADGYGVPCIHPPNLISLFLLRVNAFSRYLPISTNQDAGDSTTPNEGADGGSTWETNEVIIVSLVGGALFIVALVAGVLLCLCYRRQSIVNSSPNRTQGTINTAGATGERA